MRFTYNKLLLVGHCQSGKDLILNLLNHVYSNHFVHYHIEPEIEDNIIFFNYIKFINFIVPNEKILLGSTRGTHILKGLRNDVFQTWKFIQIDREVESSLYNWAYFEDIHNNNKELKNFNKAIDFLFKQISHQNMLFNTIRHRAIRFNFNDLFNNTSQTINKVFNFLELDVPDESIISYYKDREEIFRHLIKNKCKTGEEYNLLGNRKKEIKDMIDYFIKGK